MAVWQFPPFDQNGRTSNFQFWIALDCLDHLALIAIIDFVR
jgi:hypothetical protein